MEDRSQCIAFNEMGAPWRTDVSALNPRLDNISLAPGIGIMAWDTCVSAGIPSSKPETLLNGMYS